MNESAKAIDRRPIATRNRKWAQSTNAWLAARNVSPNAISITEMCACIAAGLALGLTSVEYNRILWLVAAIGGRTCTGSMMPFKHGLGMLVAETNVPVVPCGLIGSFEALPPDRKVPRPMRIKLIVGEPLQFAATPNDREDWSQIARSLESSVRNLVAQ